MMASGVSGWQIECVIYGLGKYIVSQLTVPESVQVGGQSLEAVPTFVLP